jgi:hypothetical protein
MIIDDMTIRLHSMRRSERVASTAAIPQFMDILFRKVETRAINLRDENSIAEGCDRAKNRRGAMLAFSTRTGFRGQEKIFYLNRP